MQMKMIGVVSRSSACINAMRKTHVPAAIPFLNQYSIHPSIEIREWRVELIICRVELEWYW